MNAPQPTKYQVFRWYMKKPSFYPFLLILLLRKLERPFTKNNTPEDKAQAEAWCKEHSVDSANAIRKITNDKRYVPLRELFKIEYDIATVKAKNCPVRMGGHGDLDLLYYLAEHAKATKVIETGVAYGWSSMALLLSMYSRSGSILISTDIPYPYRDSDQYVGIVVPGRLRNNWELLRFPDRLAIKKAVNKLGSIDLCHYDSDKSYEGRKWAYPILWNALRKGGVFISDDVNDNLMFRNFCIQVNKEPIIVEYENKYVGIIIKKKGPTFA